MKTKPFRSVLGGLLFSLMLVAYIPPVEIKLHELKLGEEISFDLDEPHTPERLYNASYARGAYDLSGFEILTDKKGNLTIHDIQGAAGIHQNELEILNCAGTCKRVEDTVLLKLTTQFNHFYLFKMEDNSVVEELGSKSVEIKLMAKTPYGNYCPVKFKSRFYINLIAIPNGVAEAELFKPRHGGETVGEFSYFSLSDSTGKIRQYSPGDYVIIGGNGLKGN